MGDGLHARQPGEWKSVIILQICGIIESFNGKMRKECLDRQIFRNIVEAKEVIMNWAGHYNEERPHKSLNNLAPYEFIDACNVKANCSLLTGL